MTPSLAGALLRTQPDQRLAELAREGSERAFDELVRRHPDAARLPVARLTSGI